MRIEFVPQDVWIGVYWKTRRSRRLTLRTFYVCIVPCFPIIFDVCAGEVGDG